MADEPEATEDRLGEDAEFDPTIEPKSSKAWLAIIVNAERAFEDYQRRADSIDKLFSDLKSLAADSRDRQFQLFWANIQVLGPSIYSRPPIPVVVPKFKDRRPIYRLSSEMLERSTNVAFDMTDINGVMMLLRDDLAIQARGAAWVRYETKKESDTDSERVVVEHLDRKDFLHDPARNWLEVGWVARRAWLTRKEMRKRFRKTSGDAYKDAAYIVQKEDKDNGAADSRQKAGVWEIWSKTENRVVWVAEGCEKLLDDDKPHLKLENFYPCPKPAYATVQRRSLVPVPDVVFYKDQLEEINSLTGRIHALADAIKVRGFYPAGMSEAGDAIETAIKSNDDRQVLVPISNWAAFGGNTGDPIVWLPIDMIQAALTGLVELRRQIIDDVYQIMGLSDIMRGSTDAEETLGAQQLKSQYGSVRIRDKQSELVRVARDLVRIAAEIMAENFTSKTLFDMSQMEIPTDADIRKQVKALEDQAKGIVQQSEQAMDQAKSNPQLMQQAQENPEKAQQMIEQAQQAAQEQIGQLGQQAAKLREQPTIEKIMDFLRDQKTRPFVLDIETDSTIAPDEQQEKQSRTEFVTALGGLIQQFGPVLQTQPAMAGMVGEVIKFAMAPFRAGRELEGKIEEAIEQMTAQSQKPQPNPEAEAAKATAAIEQQRLALEQQTAQLDAQMKQADEARKAEAHKLDTEIKTALADHQAKLRERETAEKITATQEQRANAAQKHTQDMDKGVLELSKLTKEIERIGIQAAATVQSAQIDAESAEQSADINERSFEQKSRLTEQQAKAKEQA